MDLFLVAQGAASCSCFGQSYSDLSTITDFSNSANEPMIIEKPAHRSCSVDVLVVADEINTKRLKLIEVVTRTVIEMAKRS